MQASKRKRHLALGGSLLFIGTLTLICFLWVRAQQWQHTIDRRLIQTVVDPADWDDSALSLALLKAGADPDSRVDEMPPPTFIELVRILLRLSSPPVNHNPTALMIACGADWRSSTSTRYWRSSSDSALVREMLKHTMNLDARTDHGETALMFACTYRDADIVALLLQKGASPNIQNDDGETALHLATKCQQTDTVALLLSHHADVNLKNKGGETPLDIARGTYYPSPTLIRILKQAGATRR